MGLAANRVSPEGLALNRNYFPNATNSPLPTPAITKSPRAVPGTELASLSATQLVAPKLSGKGLQLVDGNQAAQLFHSSRAQPETFVFIDARNGEHYREGHIPGAYQFDPYHPEQYFTTVLPVCTAAAQVIVYCTGGDCEDSEYAAILLRDAGINPQKLFVFAGGITEWTTNTLPVEVGVRNSGNLRKAGQ